jgi:hypothetical protein
MLDWVGEGGRDDGKYSNGDAGGDGGGDGEGNGKGDAGQEDNGEGVGETTKKSDPDGPAAGAKLRALPSGESNASASPFLTMSTQG